MRRDLTLDASRATTGSPSWLMVILAAGVLAAGCSSSEVPTGAAPNTSGSPTPVGATPPVAGDEYVGRDGEWIFSHDDIYGDQPGALFGWNYKTGQTWQTADDPLLDQPQKDASPFGRFESGWLVASGGLVYVYAEVLPAEGMRGDPKNATRVVSVSGATGEISACDVPWPTDQVAVADGALYLTMPEDAKPSGLMRVNAADCSEQWDAPAPVERGFDSSTPVAVAGDGVTVLQPSGSARTGSQLRGVSQDSGAHRWVAQVGGEASDSTLHQYLSVREGTLTTWFAYDQGVGYKPNIQVLEWFRLSDGRRLNSRVLKEKPGRHFHPEAVAVDPDTGMAYSVSAGHLTAFGPTGDQMWTQPVSDSLAIKQACAGRLWTERDDLEAPGDYVFLVNGSTGDVVESDNGGDDEAGIKPWDPPTVCLDEETGLYGGYEVAPLPALTTP